MASTSASDQLPLQQRRSWFQRWRSPSPLPLQDEHTATGVPSVQNNARQQHTLYFGPHFLSPSGAVDAQQLFHQWVAADAPGSEEQLPAVTQWRLPGAPPPPEMRTTRTLRALIHIHKNSFHLVLSDKERPTLQFLCDAVVPAKVALSWQDQATDENEKYTKRIEVGKRIPVSLSLPSLKQSLNPDHVIVALEGEQHEEASLRLTLTADPDVPSPWPQDDEAREETTILQVETKQWHIISARQWLTSEQIHYALHEIYGIADSNSQLEMVESGSHNAETAAILPAKETADNEAEINAASSRECVVCMAEDKDTTVLPCRHMCLCRGCAEVLRTQSAKCPICRQPFHSLLHIGIAGKASNSTD